MSALRDYMLGDNNEVYLDIDVTGVFNLWGQLKCISATNNGTMYGIGLDG